MNELVNLGTCGGQAVLLMPARFMIALRIGAVLHVWLLCFCTGRWATRAISPQLPCTAASAIAS